MQFYKVPNYIAKRKEQIGVFNESRLDLNKLVCCSVVSGTFLVELHSACAEEWLKITGALETSKASLMVRTETWDKSTIIPNLFISFTNVYKGIHNYLDLGRKMATFNSHILVFR